MTQWMLALALFACADKPSETPADTEPDSTSAEVDDGVDEEVDEGTDETDSDSTTDESCLEVQAFLDRECSSCHGSTPTDGLDLRDIGAVVGANSAHIDQPLIAPGDPANSYLIHKILGTHEDVDGPGVQMPPGVSIDAADTAMLTAWIEDGAVCALDPEVADAEYDPNTLDQDALFVCDGSPASSAGRLRRIDKLQLRRRIGLERDHALAANPLEAPGSARYSTYSEGVTMDVATLDLYLDMLPYVGEPWIGTNSWDRESLLARADELECIYDDASPDEACVAGFAQTYLETAVVRGALDPDEVTRLTAFAMDVLAEEASTGASRDESMTLITSAAWLHTSGLFESELGVSAADEHGRHRLGDAELAGMIARMLSDRGMDAVSIYLYDNDLETDERWTDETGPHMPGLAEAARDGSIQDPAVAAALVREYAAGVDPDREDEWIDYGTHSLLTRHDRAEAWMADRLDQFFLEWFDVLRFQSGFQDAPNATTQWDADDPLHYQRSLDELRAFEGWNEPEGLMLFVDAVARVVSDDTDVLKTLLTTNTWYLPATSDSSDYSNRLFGVEADIDYTRDARWNTLPDTERGGLLTHPVWLAAHGDAFESGPSIIHRGKWVRENLLCETVPPLELVTVEAKLPDTDGTQSARERVEEGIETRAECMACHQYMNDLGKPFELYNHAGGVRVDDHGAVPDGSTTVSNAPDPSLNGSYADPMAFTAALADSDYVERCFIRQTFRFFAGRDETYADACVLAEMESAYSASGGSFVALLETLATHDAMTYRTNEEAP